MSILKQNAAFLFVVIALSFNILFWQNSHTIQFKWLNVPPVPSLKEATASGFSDAEFSYRVNGLMLQNLGSVGGQGINLRDYNYSKLEQWFFLQDKLNEQSNFTPMIAAYYYGAVDDSKKIAYLLDYLKLVGERPYGGKWRWLGQAVFLARYKMKDMDKALELANVLAANMDPDIGMWAKQMPALIHQAEGNTQEAYIVMMNILKDSLDDLHPNEINFMKGYICNTILKDKLRKDKPPLCQ